MLEVVPSAFWAWVVKGNKVLALFARTLVLRAPSFYLRYLVSLISHVVWLMPHTNVCGSLVESYCWAQLFSHFCQGTKYVREAILKPAGQTICPLEYKWTTMVEAKKGRKIVQLGLSRIPDLEYLWDIIKCLLFKPLNLGVVSYITIDHWSSLFNKQIYLHGTLFLSFCYFDHFPFVSLTVIKDKFIVRYLLS